MFQCIYGMVFFKKDDLKEYLCMFEEVKECDY